MVFLVLVVMIFIFVFCVMLFKFVKSGEFYERIGFFGWFNCIFNCSVSCYEIFVGKILYCLLCWMLIYVFLFGGMVFLFLYLLILFLLLEDCGMFIILV